jgi:hypothetical protein
MILTLLHTRVLIASCFPEGQEPWESGVIVGASGTNRQSPLGLFPAQPTPRLYGIPSQLTFSKTVRISGRTRNSWAIAR